MSGSDVMRHAKDLALRPLSSFLGPMVLTAVLASIVVSQHGATVTSTFTSACLASGVAFAALSLAGLAPAGVASAILGVVILTFGCSTTFAQDLDRMLQASLAVGLLLAVMLVRPVRRHLLSGIPESVRVGILASVSVLSMSCVLGLCGVVDGGNGGSVALAGIFDPVFVDALISLFATAILLRSSVPAASLLGTLIATFAGIPLGLTQAPSGPLAPPDFSLVLASGADLANGLARIPLSLASPQMAGLVVSLALCLLVLGADPDSSDLTSAKASFIPGASMAVASFLGIPGLCVSPKAFSDRSVGRLEGAIAAGAFMLILSVCSPLVACVPVSAAFGPLLFASVAPLRGLARLDLNDLGGVLPAVGMIASVLVTGSLAWAVAAGFLLDLGLRLGSGQVKSLGWPTIALDLLCIVFVLAATGL